MPAERHLADRFALPPCRVNIIDQNSILVVRLDTGATAGLDARWQSFLESLRMFRTLQEHAIAIAQSVPELKGQVKSIEDALRTLLPRGLFVSASELMDRYHAAPRQQPMPVTVCVRTCDRPQSLCRLLVSLSDNQAANGLHWKVEVHDDSRLDESIVANRALVKEMATTLDVAYLGRDAQHALIRQLSDACPDDAPHLEWLLSTQHPDHVGKPTHGLMSNHIFMRHAGQRVLMIDDDAVLNAWRLPGVEQQPAFDNTQRVGSAFLTESDAAAALTHHPGDPLLMHAKVLGRTVSEAFELIAGSAWTADSLAGVRYDWAVPMRPRDARVRYTVNGLLGDPGSVRDHVLLFQAPEAIPAIIGDGQAYRTFRASPRMAFNGGSRPVLFNSSKFHQATCAGLDLAPYAAPLMPAARGEDVLLGRLLRFLYPGDYAISLPFALEHRPPEARDWRFAPELLDLPTSAPLLLGDWLARLPAPGELDPQARLALFSDTVLWVARRSELSSAVHDAMVVHQNQKFSNELAVARRVLTTMTRGCEEWRNDVAAVGQWAASALQQARPLDPAVSDAVAKQLLRYAEALPAWNRAFAACSKTPAA